MSAQASTKEKRQKGGERRTRVPETVQVCAGPGGGEVGQGRRTRPERNGLAQSIFHAGQTAPIHTQYTRHENKFIDTIFFGGQNLRFGQTKLAFKLR